MEDLPAGSIERIAQGRIEAEKTLQQALERTPHSEDYEAYIPPFREYAKKLFDDEAREHLPHLRRNRKAFQAFLTDELLPRIVEAVLPSRSLMDSRIGRPERDVRKRTSGAEGALTKEDYEISCAPHGDWENFAPRHIHFEFRLSLRAEDSVRQALTQELGRRVHYWAGKIPAQPGVSESDEKERPREVLARLRSKYGINRRGLARRAGISPDTLRNIERGKHVREEKIAALAEVFHELGETDLTYRDLLP